MNDFDEEVKRQTGFTPLSSSKMSRIGFGFVLLFTFLSLYLIVEDIRIFINKQITFIFSDFQLGLAVLILLGLTLGWYILRAFCLAINILHDYICRNFSKNITNRVRYALITFFFSVIISHYLINISFNNPVLYLVSFSFWMTSVFFYFIVFQIRMKLFDFDGDRSCSYFDGNINQRDEERKKRYRPKLIHYFYLCVAILMTILSIWNEPFNTLVVDIWHTLFEQLWLGILFTIILLITVFYGFLVFFLLLFRFLAITVFRYDFKERVNKFRVIFSVFAIVLLLAKNLDGIIVDPFQRQFWSFILSAIASIITGIIIRKIGLS